MTERPPGAVEQITASVEAWPGVESRSHSFGAVGFRLSHHELGHLHGERFADLPLPHRLRDELIADGQAWAHQHLPDSGWITSVIDEPADREPAIDPSRRTYERARRS